MYELDKRDSFERELSGLVKRLDKRIKDLMEKVSTDEKKASDKEIAEMNELKLHRYKMKEAIIFMNRLSDETWRMEKKKLQHAFEAANQILTQEYNH